MSPLTAVEREYQELPLDQQIGKLVMTSVSDRPCALERARELLILEGLDATLIPAKRPEVFDYERACRSVQTRRGKVGDQRQIVTVGEVVTNGAESVYQITAELRDEANRVIEHKKGMRVVYDKTIAGDPILGDDPIRFEPIDDEQLYRSLADLGDQIKLHFFAHRGMLPGQKIRDILRGEFRGMHGTRWTNSAWFLSVQHHDTLHAWKRVVQALYPDATFDVLSLPKTRENRDMLGEKLATHVREDAEKLIGDMAGLLHGGAKVNQRQFEKMRDARQAVAEHAETMQSLYGDELTAVTDAMHLLNEQLMEMYGRVEA